MTIMAMAIYLVINLVGMMIRVGYAGTFNIGKISIQLITFVLLFIGIKRILQRKSRFYSLLILAFMLNIFNQFIFPYENFYVGYFILLLSVIIMMLLLTFLYKLRHYTIYFFFSSIGFLFAYDLLFFIESEAIIMDEIRIIMTFLLVVIYLITRLIKSRYYQIMNYIYRLMYRNIEMDLPNRLQLMHDIKELEKNKQHFFLMAIDFVNMESLNRRFDYLGVLKAIKDVLHRTKKKCAIELYRIDYSMFGFIIKDPEKVESLTATVALVLNSQAMMGEERIHFDFRILGTQDRDVHEESLGLINNLYHVKYSNKVNEGPFNKEGSLV